MHKTPPFLHVSPPEAPEYSPASTAPAPPLLQLQSAGAYEAPQGRDFPPHHHPLWEMVYYRAGHPRCQLGNKEYDVRPGMMLLNPPGITHAEHARTAYANFFCYIEAPLENVWPRVCYDDSSGSLGHLCAALVREWSGNGLERDIMLTSLMSQFAVLLRRACEERYVCGEERVLREVERLFEEHFARALTIESVAHEVGVAPSTLREYFVRRRGCAPQAYLHQVRARHAVSLIRSSDLTLEAVAELCGYTSASHLSRHLKRATGQCPGELRH